MRIVGIALFLAGCGSAPCPQPAAPQPAVAQQGPAVVDVPPTTAAADPTLPNTSPATAGSYATLPSLTTSAAWKAVGDGHCFAYSKSTKQVACLQMETRVRRGHVRIIDVHLRFLGSRTAEAARIHIYDGTSLEGGVGTDLESDPIKPKKSALANAALKAGEFVAEGSPLDMKGASINQYNMVELKLDGKKALGTIPEPFGPPPHDFTGDADDCMRWVPHSGTRFGAVAVVKLRVEHDFTAAPGQKCTVSQSAINVAHFSDRETLVVVD